MTYRFVVLAAAGISFGAPVLAQENEGFLGTIIIGARHFEEAAEDVPGTVSLKFPSDIAAQDTVDLGDITADVPNVTFQKSNADERLIFRGISAYPNALADPVGVVVNGVALPLGTIQAPTPIALDQATVLVGPQGAHYGRNSEAGLISLEFTDPGIENRIALGITAAEQGTHTGKAYLNRKVGDVGLVLAFEIEDSDGEVSNSITADNLGGQRERVTAYGGISIETESGTTISLTHIYEDEDLGKEQFRYTTGAFVTPRFVSNYNDRSTEQRRINVTSLRVKHSFENFDFLSITGFTGFDREFSLDFDTSPLALGVTALDLDDRTFSQEFRLSSPSDAEGPWNWSLGVNYFRQDTDVTFNLGAFNTNRRTQIEYEGAAIYGFAEYEMSDRFRVGAGARIDHLKSEGTQTFVSPFVTAIYSGSQSTTEFLPKLTFAYDINNQTLLYGSVSRGYLAGGYNYNFANSAANFTFNPEYTTTAEVGVRFDWVKTTLDIAAFYSDVTDKQIVQVVPGGAQRVNNAANVEIYGVEARLEHVTEGPWSFNASVGLQSAKAKSFVTTVFTGAGLAMVDYSGNRLPFSPDLTYGIGVNYDQGDWFGHLQVNGSSSYFFDPANTLEQGAFATVDASVGYRFAENAKVTLWATNLFDAKYYTAGLNTPRGTLVEDGAGRRIGLTLSAEW